jgi:hypothetical protein
MLLKQKAAIGGGWVSILCAMSAVLSVDHFSNAENDAFQEVLLHSGRKATIKHVKFLIMNTV